MAELLFRFLWKLERRPEQSRRTHQPFPRRQHTFHVHLHKKQHWNSLSLEVPKSRLRKSFLHARVQTSRRLRLQAGSAQHHRRQVEGHSEENRGKQETERPVA